MWLGVGAKVDAVGVEALEVDDGVHHPLATEPVERPQEHEFKSALSRVGEELRELPAFVGTGASGLPIDVLADDLVIHFLAVPPKLAKLVLRCLLLVFGRDPRVDRNSCLFGACHDLKSTLLGYHKTVFADVGFQHFFGW